MSGKKLVQKGTGCTRVRIRGELNLCIRLRPFGVSCLVPVHSYLETPHHWQCSVSTACRQRQTLWDASSVDYPPLLLTPNSREGASEPPPKTKVEGEEDAIALLELLDSKVCDAWIRVLHLVKTVPSIDMGRVTWFVDEWRKYSAVQTKNPQLHHAIVSLRVTAIADSPLRINPAFGREEF